MEYLFIFDIFGIIAFSITGYILGAKANLDIMGVFITAVSSALAGGMIRDVVVGTAPHIFTISYPLITVFIVVIISILVRLDKYNNLMSNNIFILMDAIGLSTFAITGAIVGLEQGFNLGGVLFLGFLTAVGGGIIRDILLNQIPAIMVNEIYASIAILVSLFVYITWQLHCMSDLYMILIMVIGVIVRLIVVRLKLHLPTIKE